MRSMGLVGTAKPLSDAPAAVWLTREGMTLVGLSGPVVEPKVSQYRHDSMIVDLAAWLLKNKPTHELVTEREMRRADTVNQVDNRPPTYAVLRLTAKSRQRIYPDLVTITRSGKQLAHELEYSRKDFGRLKRLMGAYANTERVAGVRYYCLPGSLSVVSQAATEINQKAASLGMGQRVFVEAWPPSDTTAQNEDVLVGGVSNGS